MEENDVGSVPLFGFAPEIKGGLFYSILHPSIMDIHWVVFV